LADYIYSYSRWGINANIVVAARSRPEDKVTTVWLDLKENLKSARRGTGDFLADHCWERAR
jgi:hypothetical protein